MWAAGSLFLLGGLLAPVGCGPNGVRKVVATNGGSGGTEETGGMGGADEETGGSGGTGGKAGAGGTGGAVIPDAAPDLGRDVAPDLVVMPDAGPDLAPDVNPMEAPPPDVMGAPCGTSTGGAWVNNPFTAQMGMFTATFDATPSASPGDTVMGLSSGPATAYTGLATIIRFNPEGTIDARNAGAYASMASIPYAANMTYRFRLQVNVTAHTYSIFVTPPGGQETTVGMGYAFRTEQNKVTSVNSWAVQTDAPNTAKLCNFAVQ
jgi:hypothetical protein